MITAYQRWISPYKGFRCGYGVLFDSQSCSGFARRAITRYGWSLGMRLARDRMQRCGQAVAAHRSRLRRRRLTLTNSKARNQDKPDLCSIDICSCDMIHLGTMLGNWCSSKDAGNIGPCSGEGAEVACDIGGCIPSP